MSKNDWTFDDDDEVTDLFNEDIEEEDDDDDYYESLSKKKKGAKKPSKTLSAKKAKKKSPAKKVKSKNTVDDEEETSPREKSLGKGGKSKKGLNKGVKIALIVLAVLLVCALIGGGVYYYFFYSSGRLVETAKVGDVITEEDSPIEARITKIEILDEIGEIKAEEGKVFVAIQFEYKNVSKSDISWEQFPITSLVIYDGKDKGAEQINVYETINEDALKEYMMLAGIDLSGALDKLASGDTRLDVDVYKIKSDNFKKNPCVKFDLFNVSVPFTKEGAEYIDEDKDKEEETTETGDPAAEPTTDTAQ